jgi:hypothetical protein
MSRFCRAASDLDRVMSVKKRVGKKAAHILLGYDVDRKRDD